MGLIKVLGEPIFTKNKWDVSLRAKNKNASLPGNAFAMCVL